MHFKWLKDLSPKETIGHYLKMESFWKKAGNKRTASVYANKAKRIREMIGEVNA